MSSSASLRKFSVIMFGSRMHYAVPRILQSAGLLGRFYTDICAVQGWPQLLAPLPSSLLPRPLRRLKGRIPTGIPREKLTSFPLLGLQNQLRLGRGSSLEESCRTHAWASKQLAHMVIDKGLSNEDILFTFDRAGLELMQHFKAQGGVCVMEQTVAPFRVWRRLVREEQQRFAEWEGPAEPEGAMNWFAEREEQEWKLADTIVCGSEFVREGIVDCGGPAERVRVVPYGVDRRLARIDGRPRHGGPLRVLTVGEVGLRKGAPYVLEVARRLKGQAQFRMVGAVAASPQARSALAEHVELTGQVPRSEVAAHFAWADVFFLPSLLEGSATVVYEALSAGLPVVCTPNTGSVVRHGHNGYIVPIRDVDAMCDALSRLADDPAYLETMAANARNSDADYSFDNYRRGLLEVLGNFAHGLP